VTINKYSTDVVIIGAGPSGLFSIFECGMLKMKCHIIDSLEEIGGQCTALYPEKPIYDIPAYPVITGGELIHKLEKQVEPFNPVYHLNQHVTYIEKNNDIFRVETSNGVVIESKAIIIAAGAGAFGVNRPPIDNILEYEGKSIFYMIKQRNNFADKTLVIAGGGDTAVDWAISLSQIAKKIYFVHRRDKFRASPQSVEKLKNISKNSDKIEMIIPYQLSGLFGKNGKLEDVQVKDLDDNKKTLKADYLLPFFGMVPTIGEIANWGLEIKENHLVVDSTTAETNIKGIFAIGDIATYPNKLKLILTGFSESTQAAHSAYSLVFPDKNLHFIYSTTQGIEG